METKTKQSSEGKQSTKTTRTRPINQTKLRAMYLLHTWQEEAETTAMIDRYNEREEKRMQQQLRSYGYVSAHHVGSSACM